MSYDLFNWAKDQPLVGLSGCTRSTAKLVLITMASTAKPHYYGSINTLAKQTCLDRKTVFRAIHALCEFGLLVDSGNRRGKTKTIVEYHFKAPEVIHKQSQSRNSSQNGTVPKKVSQISHEAVPNFPGSSTKNGIQKQEGKQERNLTRAHAHTREADARECQQVDGKKKKSRGNSGMRSLSEVMVGLKMAAKGV